MKINRKNSMIYNLTLLAKFLMLTVCGVMSVKGEIVYCD